MAQGMVEAITFTLRDLQSSSIPKAHWKPSYIFMVMISHVYITLVCSVLLFLIDVIITRMSKLLLSMEQFRPILWERLSSLPTYVRPSLTVT